MSIITTTVCHFINFIFRRSLQIIYIVRSPRRILATNHHLHLHMMSWWIANTEYHNLIFFPQTLLNDIRYNTKPSSHLYIKLSSVFAKRLILMIIKGLRDRRIKTWHAVIVSSISWSKLLISQTFLSELHCNKKHPSHLTGHLDDYQRSTK